MLVNWTLLYAQHYHYLYNESAILEQKGKTTLKVKYRPLGKWLIHDP